MWNLQKKEWKETSKIFITFRNSSGDKLGLFRQQASIVGRKKEIIEQKMDSINEEVIRLQSEIEAKKNILKSRNGDVRDCLIFQILKGNELKAYLIKIRDATIKRNYPAHPTHLNMCLLLRIALVIVVIES